MQKKKLYIVLIIMVLVFFMSSAVTCNRCSRGLRIFPKQGFEEDVKAEEEVAVEEEEEAGIDSKIETEELPEQEKLDEIEQTYSTEFRQYMETLDKDYLEILLEDDNAIKQEYDLFDWRSTFYENNIIFTENGNIFPADWYGSGINAKAESLSPGEVERSKSIIITALNKYPALLLKSNLRSVYVLKSMNFYGVNYGGTNLPPDIVYIANDGVSMGYTDTVIEKTFHHEFSSVLKYNYGFDETEWRQVNPAGFVYFDEATGGAGAIKAGKASQVFDPKEHKIGFLYEYAESTLENDFNSFAENIFMGEESFFNIVESYDKLEMKLNLIVAFYNSLDPVFTIEYFKGL